MKCLTVWKGHAVSILRDNIDTDILIPKQYLKTVRKTGFAHALFDPWRYDKDGKPIADFVLNKPEHQHASILIAGDNFGCGSSREHAAWALADFGFRIVIAGGYSDIFYNNWIHNGNLPITMGQKEREALAKAAMEEDVTVDLPNQTVSVKGLEWFFDIPNQIKERLMAGEDAIDRILRYEEAIAAYERTHDR